MGTSSRRRCGAANQVRRAQSLRQRRWALGRLLDCRSTQSPSIGNVNVDVYVRDMTRPIGDPGAYELGVGARRRRRPRHLHDERSRLGSEPTAGSSISADGRMIVFRTRVVSDLPNVEAGRHRIPGQVFVRDREVLRRTALVTRSMTDGASAGGAIYTSPVGNQRRRLDRRLVRQERSPPDVLCSHPRTPARPTSSGAGSPTAPQHPPAVSRAPLIRTIPVAPRTPPVDPGDQISLGPLLWPPDSFWRTRPPRRPRGWPAAVPQRRRAESRLSRRPGAAARPSWSGTREILSVTDMSEGVTRKGGNSPVDSRTNIRTDVLDPVDGDLRRRAEDRVCHVARTVFALPTPRLTTPPPVRDGAVAELYVARSHHYGNGACGCAATTAENINGDVVGKRWRARDIVTTAAVIAFSAVRVQPLTSATAIGRSTLSWLSEVDPNADAASGGG